MKITAIHVDGYGTLAGLDLDGLSPTLSVVYGRNEAGKSTLLDFVRAVLFGIPDRRSRQNRREPLRGGRHGGTLRLLDADGRPWILERHSDSREPVLTGPDGHLGGEAELHALLGGANAGLFRSIFAFGLDELTSLETLDDDDVRDLVFTAGVLGAGRSATRAMRELESRRATIVRPRADAAANDLRHRLDAVDSSLRATRAAAENYASAQAEYRRLRVATRSARQSLEELRRRDIEIDRLQRCWPYWNRIHDGESRLTALGPPDEAETRLLELAPEIRRLDADRSAHALRLASLRQQRADLAGIERSIGELREQRTRLARSSTPPPPADGPTDPDGPPRDEVELRRAEQDVQLLRGLIGQRDQLLAGQTQQAAMERMTRRSHGAARPRVAFVLLAAAAVATVVVAANEFAARHAAPGALGIAIALALAATALVLAGSRPRPAESSAGPSASGPAPVDPQRLTGEIAHTAQSLGLAAAPALVEVETVAARLEQEREGRRRADELERAVSELDDRVAEREAAHRRVSRAIEVQTATVDAFEDAVNRAAATCRLGTEGSAVDVCGRLAAALAAAEQAAGTRRGLVSAIEAANADLSEAAGFGPEADRLRLELSAADPVSWAAQSDETKEGVATAEQEFEATRDAERDMARTLDELRTSDEIARLEVERASLATQLEDALTEWVVLGMAHRLLEGTVARYEREKQPAVIARASELFSDVTAGRYVRLVAREDDRAVHHDITAISAADERVDSGSLSRGTAEQLYLCLRLGLAAAHAERTVSLPFVLDDVLVNFDPARAAAVARSIAALSRSHQVLAFTCHPHVVDVFAAADPDCVVIELPLAEMAGTAPGP
ncbi:MAG: AAA family ATPase [Acidimicrobiales bacterium]